MLLVHLAYQLKSLMQTGLSDFTHVVNLAENCFHPF